MAILDKWLIRKIESNFYSYFQIKARIELMKEEILYSSGKNIDENIGGMAGSRKSDPTALKGISLASDRDLLINELWLKVIEQTLEKFQDTEKETLFRMKYWDHKEIRQILKALHIQKSTYFDWLNHIQIYAALLATQYGLVKIIREEKVS